MRSTITIIFLFFISTSFAQKPKNLFKITPKINQTVTYKSNLNLGKKINDLSWAWKSTNACFSATQQKEFNGNHVFFTGIIPKNTTYSIRLIPKNKNDNLSLYIYEIEANSTNLVPNLPSCLRCESDVQKDTNSFLNKNQSHIRKIKTNISSKTKTRIVIGVVGTKKLSKGEFSLEIKLLK